MNTATFFLSTGRCGTQWLAEYLNHICKENTVIEHEPLHDRYYPRIMLGSRDLEAVGNAAEIISHCSRIEETLKTTSYIECGWPTWGAIPYLLKRFEGRIKIVQLVRHPIPVACSWVSHRAFCPPLIPEYSFQEKILASPFDQGSSFPQYREKWHTMNPFEKSLFFWAEVNNLGLKLDKETDTPWLQARFEDLFHGNALPDLMSFLGLTMPENREEALKKTKDNFHYLCDSWWNPLDIQKYPEIMKIATQLGYDPLTIDEEKLRSRYYPFF